MMSGTPAPLFFNLGGLSSLGGPPGSQLASISRDLAEGGCRFPNTSTQTPLAWLGSVCVPENQALWPGRRSPLMGQEGLLNTAPPPRSMGERQCHQTLTTEMGNSGYPKGTSKC